MNQQDPSSTDTEKRLLLAIALSMAILFGAPYAYRWLFPSAQPPKPAVTTTAVPQTAPEKAPISAAKTPAERTEPSLPATAATPQTIEVENADFVLRWSNVGAVLESAQLKHHGRNGNTLELLPQGLPAGLPRPFELRLQDAALDKVAAVAVYDVNQQAGAKVVAPTEVVFQFRGGGVELVKRVRVPATGYRLDMSVEARSARGPEAATLGLGPGMGPLGAETQGDFANPLVTLFQAGSIDRHQTSDLEDGPQSLDVRPRWVAMDSRYFAYLVLGPDAFGRVRLSGHEWKRRGADGAEVATQLAAAQVSVESGRSFTVFLGPKDQEVLKRTDPSLGGLVDYGWFAILVDPLLFCLRFIYAYLGNYGWAIIVLTLVINLVLFPIRYKQMVSMKKMADLQPQMRSIQDRYKRLKRDDPRRQEMNAELMKLYKQHGVNPLGGCLPLLIQMPFLFAFYQMLASSFELRGAHFMLWIKDLSLPDPYYVTPLVMGATMVIQQKMTPASGDPAQRRMMMLLPVVFTFFFLNVSSGLAVYFLFSNVFGMILQLALQKWSPAMGVRKPAGDR
jgi:YidC/Oxa1 family membrane protein insertase